MKVLLRRPTLFDTGSPFHLRSADILVEHGRITAVGPELKVDVDTKILNAAGAWCSPGWVDCHVQSGDPGFEHREDLNSLSEAAMRGGYTALLVNPNTQPAIHTKSEVAYLTGHSRSLPTDIFPIGAVSENCKGRDLAEILDMRHAGAIAFGDGTEPIQHHGLMLRALQYVTPFQGVIINRPNEQSLTIGAQMHEGVSSTMLGVRGIPSLAEELMVERDLQLLRYTNSKLHLAGISTAGSVARIRRAKDEGLHVTASVPLLNLLFNDEQLFGFDPNFKVLPPLRSTADREALCEGLLDGTLDFWFSNHIPLDTEAKDREFLYADFGAATIETAAAAWHTSLAQRFSPEQFIHLLAVRPREIFQIPIPQICEGKEANLTLFHPDFLWTFRRADARSKAVNSPFFEKSFRGAVVATFKGKNLQIYHDL
jgi:dihydroorotase